MKLTSILVAVAMTLAACQTITPKPEPVAAPVQQTLGQAKVREAQTGLKNLGYYKSGVDGIIGPISLAATKRCRTDLGMDPDGGLDQEFLDKMQRYLELNPPRKGIPAASDVFTAQRGLTKLGMYDGRVNGFYDRATLAAVVDFRLKRGMRATRGIDANLLARIEREVAAIDG